MDTVFARFDLSLILIVIISLLLIVKQHMSIEVVLVLLRHKRER